MTTFYHNVYDYGFRGYYATIGRFTSMDPLCEQYYHISPYAYCANNFLNAIAPDGCAWFLPNGCLAPNTVEAQRICRQHLPLQWTDYTSQEEMNKAGIEGTYYGESVVVFNGYYDERLGKGDKLVNDKGVMPDGAKMANVTVFGSNGEDDIAQYLGYTMSSDPEKFGVLANGEYNVYRVPRTGPYDSPWAIEKRGQLPTLYDVNPAHPERIPSYMDGVFVHRYNLDGKAGAFYDEKGNKWRGRSEGCLLIEPGKWGNFMRQLQKTNSFHLILNRR